jgi:hypothetical protein
MRSHLLSGRGIAGHQPLETARLRGRQFELFPRRVVIHVVHRLAGRHRRPQLR